MLRIMKQIVKVLNKDGDCLKYIYTKCPGSTIEKLKAGIYYGPPMRKLIHDCDFPNSMNEKQSCAWCDFAGRTAKIFLRNRKVVNYKGIVAKSLSTLYKIWVLP